MATFRQYLTASGNGNLLNFTGNDGGIDPYKFTYGSNKAIPGAQQIDWGGGLNKYEYFDQAAYNQAKNQVDSLYKQYNGNSTPNTTPLSTTGTGGGGGVAAKPFDIDYYNNILKAMSSSSAANEKRINKDHSISQKELQVSYDNAMGNLNDAETKLNNQKARSLSTLSNDLSKLWQNANLQLGMYGAGNSSAAQAAAYGVTDMANKESQGINDEYSDQAGDIYSNRASYKKDYELKRERLQNDLNNKLFDQREELKKNQRTINDIIREKSENRAVAQDARNRVIDSYKSGSMPKETIALKEYQGAGINNADLSGSVNVNNPNVPQAQYFSTAKSKKDEKRAY